MSRKLLGAKTRGSNKPAPPLTDAAKAEARANPGGWVYEIGGGYSATEAVPPQAIRGAWKIDDAGEIVGDFIPHPNFDPTFRRPVS